MNKKLKYIVITLIGITIVYSLFKYSEGFNKKYTREEVRKHFIQHEKEFNELVKYFHSLLPKGKKQLITFGINRNGSLRLTMLPLDKPMSRTNNYNGGDNLDLNSTVLDNVLSELKWTKHDLIIMREKLEKVNCQWIRTTEYYSNPIEIYYKKSGFGSYSYYIFEQSLDDALIKIHGVPVGKTSTSSKVAISYSSSL